MTLVATDKLGLRTTATVTITLQTVAPSIQSFGLAQGSAIGGTGNVTGSAVVSLIGTTLPGATVAALTGGAQTLAGSNGVFEFDNVPVTQGANSFTVTATNGIGMARPTSSSRGRAAPAPMCRCNGIT